MARLSSYPQDSSLSAEDRLVGSSYEGEGQNGPIYKTRTYKLSELGNFISGYVGDVNLTNSEVFNNLSNTVNNLSNTVTLNSQTITSNTAAIASATQSLTVLTSEVEAKATFQTNLAASFGTYDENGNILTFAEATANQILAASTTADYAEAQFVTTLLSNFGTYDENGNIQTLSTAFANQVLSTTTSDRYAEAEFTTNLAASIGTYNPDGTISALSSAFAQQAYELATKPDFAEASYVNNFGASLGSLNPDGTLVFNANSSYNQSIKTYIENESALVESIETLQATYATLPVTIRQPEPPTILEFNPVTQQNELVYPLGSIWIDTDDSNALYVLIEDPSDPIGYSWSPTTSEALGDLILSNSQLQTEVNFLSDNLSTTATKLTTLTSQFGVYDPATNTFTIDNNAAVTSALRTYADSGSAAAQLSTSLNAQINIGETSIVSKVDDATTAIASKPNVYNQDEPPTGTIPIKSVWYDTNDNNKPYIYEGNITGWVEARDGKVTELETYALAQKTLIADANGVVTGITIKSENSGSAAAPISDITFKTSTFNIVNALNENKLAFDETTGLTINGGGTFTGNISAASGTFNGVEINSNGITGPGFTLNSSGITTTNGNFAGTFTAGNVSIASNDIIVDNGGDILFRESGVTVGSIQPLLSGLGIGVVYTTGVWEFDGVITTPQLSATTSLNIGGGFGNTGATIYSTGSMSSDGTITAQDFVLSSDATLKENIKDYTVKPINIQYKEYNLIGDDCLRVGVIAQELEKDHPEFVKITDNGTKAVSYIDMLVAKVAELEQRIKELENGAA